MLKVALLCLLVFSVVLAAAPEAAACGTVECPPVLLPETGLVEEVTDPGNGCRPNC